MKKFLALLNKEIRELLTPQMIIPLVITIMMFFIIGKVVSSQAASSIQAKPLAVMDQDSSQYSQGMTSLLSQSNYKIIAYADITLDDALKNTLDNKSVALLVIPKGFGQSIEQGSPEKVSVYSLIRSFSIASTQQDAIFKAVIGAVNNYISDQLLLSRLAAGTDINSLKNPVASTNYVVANSQVVQGNLSDIISFITSQTFVIPIILFLIIILAAQMIATSMATEKENKTLETLLSLPVSRKVIVTAKLAASGIVAMLFAGVYILGFRGYMQNLTTAPGSTTSQANESIAKTIQALNLSFHSIDYLLLGISLFFAILAALAIAMILGAMVEDVKSVQAVITPLMILIMIPYLLTMLLDFNSLTPMAKYLVYAIPFSHPFLAAQNLLFHHYWPVIFGIIYELMVFVIFVYIASALFSSDKILTLKFNFGKKKLI